MLSDMETNQSHSCICDVPFCRMFQWRISVRRLATCVVVVVAVDDVVVVVVIPKMTITNDDWVHPKDCNVNYSCDCLLRHHRYYHYYYYYYSW
jgi:hypothetical protein